MKRMLLLIITMMLVATSHACAAVDMFYIKFGGGWSKFEGINKLKSEDDGFLDVGLGYYVMDDIRVDLAFDHYINPHQKLTAGGGQMQAKYKADTVLFNCYFDAHEFEGIKLFIGLGAGISAIEGKYRVENNPALNKSFRKKQNFSYAWYVGADKELANGFYGEVAYSYKDLGTLKKASASDSSGKLKGHHLGIGLRFSI